MGQNFTVEAYVPLDKKDTSLYSSSESCKLSEENISQKQGSAKSENNENEEIVEGVVEVISSTCFYTQGKIHDLAVDFMIDTGSTYTIIDVELYNDMSPLDKPKLEQKNLILRSANGEKLIVHGESMMEITLGNRKFNTSVKVVTLSDRSAILGLDFMKNERCVIDVSEKSMKINSMKFKISLYQQMTSKCAKVQLCESISIPPQREIILTGKIEKRHRNFDEAVGLLEEPSYMQDSKRLMIAKALVSNENNVVPVRVANFTDTPISLDKGYTVAVIHPVDPDSVVCLDEEDVGKGEEVLQVPDHLLPLLSNIDENLSDSETNKVKELISKYSDCFMTPNGELGKTTLVQHHIDTGNAKPIRQRLRLPPVNIQKDVDKEVQKLLDQGIIEKSSSPWSSPLVAVPKKDGSLRICVDFRKINTVMVNKDAYPLPKIEECINSLSGAKYYSTLDLAQGYHQAWAKESLLRASFLRFGFYRLLVDIFNMAFLVKNLIIVPRNHRRNFRTLSQNLRDFLALLFDVALPLPKPADYEIKKPLYDVLVIRFQHDLLVQI